MWSIKFPMKGPTGEIQSLGAICSDITRVKDTEAQIKVQEAQFRRLSQEYRALLDNVPDGIVHLSPDLRILWANKVAQQMIRMMDLLVEQYARCQKLYLSWDAASWHISKRLEEHIERHNVSAKSKCLPHVETAPLPVGAQFLNVIESVFSGMARAIS